MHKVRKTLTSGSQGRLKGDKRARTRATLIEAASEVAREKGYERMTQADIARRAGMTRGALQGNFKDKHEILLAIAASRWAPIVPEVTPGATLAVQMRSLAETVIAAMPARRAAAVGFTSWQTYALKHEKLRVSVVKQMAEIYAASAKWTLRLIPQADLPMPAAIFVRVLHALIEGLTYQRFMTPELVTDDVIFAAFDAIATTSPRRARQSSPHSAARTRKRKITKRETSGNL
jgi:AcrR family transcriptional regulator